MSLITPDFGLLFWMTVVFLIVLFILWKYGFPAIIKMVNGRKAYIDESLRKAHEANERLANIQKEGESILQEARERQAQILKEAQQTRDAIVEKAQEKARGEGARLLNEAKAEIESEKQNAIRDIRAQVAELSVLIAEKILKKNLDSDRKQMDMIERLLDEVSADKGNKQE
jgi:F-type H+-transporting ATPase subunit b